jgi:hypothetical protein
MRTISYIDLQKRRLKTALQRGFDLLGIEIRRASENHLEQRVKGMTLLGVEIRPRPAILDLRIPHNEQPTSFEQMFQYAQSGHSFLASIAIHKCRHLWGYNAHDVAPLTQAAYAIARGEIEQAKATLAKFYADFQPRTAAESVGLETEQHSLLNYGPLSAPLPWSGFSPSEIEKVRTIDYMTDNAQRGQPNFSRRFGPATPDEISAEIQRLRALTLSIENKGYQRHNGVDGDINGQFLVDDRDDRMAWGLLLNGGGVHRASVLAGLGHKMLPIRIRSGNFIRKSEAADWPQVTAGIYTIDEALTVFDRIITASPPPAYRQNSTAN